jgi:NTP pyrophosphatase (non-canonical NTP hydrolase)
MMSKETILAMLQEGRNADAIAQEFITNLNAAVDEIKYQEDSAKKAEEKKRRANQVAHETMEFVHDYYPDLEFGGLVDLSKNSDELGDVLIETLDAAAKEAKQLLTSFSALFPKDKGSTKGDPIGDFLKSSGLL